MNILIAEPSPIIGRLIANNLRGGLPVGQLGTANNEQDAHEQLQRADWQAIILGLGLGQMAGAALRFLAQVRASHARVPVVMVSHYADASAIRRCLERGAMGFVLHAELAEELLPSVRAAMAGEVHVSAALTRLMTAT